MLNAPTYTSERGRPATRITVNGASIGVTAARLYVILTADTSARLASNAALAERAGVRPQTIARALGELEAAGLVTRHYSRLSRQIELPEVQQ